MSVFVFLPLLVLLLVLLFVLLFDVAILRLFAFLL